MLRKIRIVAATICFTLITLLFLDFTGTLHLWFGWLAKIQFLPAVVALNVGVVAFLVILTLLFGRVYCSVICPLGVFQDIVSWISGKRKKNRFRYSPAISWLRTACWHCSSSPCLPDSRLLRPSSLHTAHTDESHPICSLHSINGETIYSLTLPSVSTVMRSIPPTCG